MLWNEVLQMLNNSQNHICIRKSLEYDGNILISMGIKENSVLGQVIANTSVVIVDNYLRVYANGNNEDSHNIYSYNLHLEKYFGDKKLIIADDIWGGLYAINNGGFNGKQGNIWYFAPDTLEWDDLEISYSEFIAWISSSNLNEFYNLFKWQSFQRDIRDIKFNQGVLIYPFLWSNECDIETADKKIVAFNELILLNIEYKERLGL